MKIKFIMFAVLCFAMGCASTAGKKSESALPNCAKKYQNIEKTYIYPHDLQICHSPALNLDLHVTHASSVKAFKPGTDELVFRAEYRPNKQIRSILYFKGAAKVKEVFFDEEGKINNVYYYAQQPVAKFNHHGIEKGYYASSATYFTQNTIEDIYLNPDGLIHQYTLADFKTGRTFAFNFKPSGILKDILVYEHRKVARGNTENTDFIYAGKAFYDNEGNLSSYEIKLSQESIIYDAKGNVLRFECRKDDCLKYNKNKLWICEGDCAKKAKQLNYTFKKIPLKNLKIPAVPSKEYMRSKVPPDFCELDIISFQCPKK